MTTEMSATEPQRRPETWIPLLIAVCACGAAQLALHLFALPFVLHLSFWGVSGAPGRFVTSLTVAAVIGIAAWAVTWFGFVAKTRLNLMDRYFLIIMGSSLAVGALFASLLTLPDLMTRRTMQEVARERQQIAAEDLAFERALGQAMGGGVLKPGVRRAELPAERARVAEAQRLLDSYRARQMARLPQDRGGAPGGSLRIAVGAYWSDWAAELRESDAELVDLGKARGAWQVSGRGVQFSAAPDLEAFDAHQARLQAIGRDLQQARALLLSGASAN